MASVLYYHYYHFTAPTQIGLVCTIVVMHLGLHVCLKKLPFIIVCLIVLCMLIEEDRLA